MIRNEIILQNRYWFDCESRKYLLTTHFYVQSKVCMLFICFLFCFDFVNAVIVVVVKNLATSVRVQFHIRAAYFIYGAQLRHISLHGKLCLLL